jgi:uncharacterized protein YdeI (YjbR/CyaY-like superfamily)
MSQAGRNPRVDAIIAGSARWRQEMQALREVVLESGLREEVKWGQPCYTLDNKNVVVIHGFKDYCALLFFKGVLMKDPANLLIRQTENVQAGRQIRFAEIGEIAAVRSFLRAYVENAIEVEKAGLNIEKKKTSEFPYPDEFRARLDASADLKAAFEALTPGRQRAYLLHFSGAKQAKTREARIEKYVPQILAGKGVDD